MNYLKLPGSEGTAYFVRDLITCKANYTVICTSNLVREKIDWLIDWYLQKRVIFLMKVESTQSCIRNHQSRRTKLHIGYKTEDNLVIKQVFDMKESENNWFKCAHSATNSKNQSFVPVLV
jgi:hypothetical protein